MPPMSVQIHIAISKPPTLVGSSLGGVFPFNFARQPPSSHETEIGMVFITLIQAREESPDIVHIDGFNRTQSCTPTFLKFGRVVAHEVRPLCLGNQMFSQKKRFLKLDPLTGLLRPGSACCGIPKLKFSWFNQSVRGPPCIGERRAGYNVAAHIDARNFIEASMTVFTKLSNRSFKDSSTS